MGLFSKFHENAVDGSSEQRGEEQSGDVDRSPGGREIKPLLESVGELLEHTVLNVQEAMFGHIDGPLPCALAMEDPFSQSDHVLTAVVEHDMRSESGSDGHHIEDQNGEKKTIVQTVRENLAHSAHIVREAVLSHTTDHEAINAGNQFPQAATPIENGDNVVVTSPVISNGTPGDVNDHSSSKTIVEAIGDTVSQRLQNMKEIVNGTSHDDVADHLPAPGIDPRTVAMPEDKSSPGMIDDPGKPGEHYSEDDSEVKGFIQTVKEAAHDVKEEMMEVVQEVKDVVMSNDTLPNVQTESITEDAGERPSMELVHTIVHD